MIETLYIHAGTHKTGTSSIQRFLRTNREQLLLEDLHLVELKGMLEVDIALSSGGPRHLRYEAIEGLDAARAIVSKENFSWVDDIETLAEFRERLLSVTENIQIIFYLRRQDSVAISQKQEGTKWLDCSIAYGHDLSALPKTLSDVAYRYLDYERKLGMWAEVFGQENIIIRIFEADHLVAGDAVHDFCNIFDIDAENYELPKRVNESFTRAGQLFLHQNHAYYKDSSPEKKLLINTVRLVDSELEDKQKLMPDRQLAMGFYQQFIESNSRLNKRFNISPREDIFNDDFSMYPQTVDEQGFSEQEAHQMYAKIFTHLSVQKKLGSRGVDNRLGQRLKDIALALPADSRQQSIDLLRVAQTLHPKGAFIRRKLLELENAEETG